MLRMDGRDPGTFPHGAAGNKRGGDSVNFCKKYDGFSG
jgi:hypothetical protein